MATDSAQLIFTRDALVSLQQDVQAKYGHNAFCDLPDVAKHGMAEHLRMQARRQRALKPRFAYPIDAQSLHEYTREILEMVQCLPCTPETHEFKHWTSMLVVTIPALSSDIQMRIAHETFVSTYQFSELFRCLQDPPSDPIGAYLLIELITFLSTGSKRTQKVILKAELLKFIRVVLLQCSISSSGELTCSIGARALQLARSFLAQKPHAFECAIRAEPSTLIMSCAFALAQYDWYCTPIGKRMAVESLKFVTLLLCNKLDNTTFQDVRVGCKYYLWNNVQDLLLQKDKPGHWFNNEGLHPGYDEVSKETAHFMATGGQKLPVDATDVADMSKESYIEALVHLFIQFIQANVIAVRDVDSDVWEEVMKLCSCHRVGHAHRKVLLSFLRSLGSPARTVGRSSTGQKMGALARQLGIHMLGRQQSKCGNARCERYENGDRKFQVCSACRIERYCSGSCQRAAWRAHKLVCNEGRPQPQPSSVTHSFNVEHEMARLKQNPRNALQAGLVPQYQIRDSSNDPDRKKNPARRLGQRYDQRIHELQEVLNFGDMDLFQRGETRLEEDLRVFEGAALCYRIYCKKRPQADHDLLWRLIMITVCRQSPPSGSQETWPSWVRELLHDSHLTQTFKWLQNVGHLTDQLCLDGHALLCGRTRRDHLCAEIGCFMSDAELEDVWQRTIIKARASFPSFECVLIQRCYFGRRLVQRFAAEPSQENDELDLCGEERYLFSRLRELLFTARFGRRLGDLVVEMRLAAWWTLPSTCCNCVSLYEQMLGAPDRADPRATKSINEISDDEALNLNAEFAIPEFAVHVRVAYSRHLWEVLHDVIAASPQAQARFLQCDACGEVGQDLIACVCGLEHYCVGKHSECQDMAWEAGHNAFCSRRPISEEWMSSLEELVLRQRVGIHPDTCLQHSEKSALRVIARKGEPWDSMRANGEQLSKCFQMLEQHIQVEASGGDKIDA